MLKLLKRCNWLWVILIAIPLIISACGGDTPVQPTQIQPPSQNDLQNNANRLWSVQGGKLKPINSSAELANLIERINRENDPNHYWYVYIFTVDGKLMFYSKIHGKVSSTDSSPTAPDSTSCDGNGTSSGYSCSTVSNPSLDGSYGTNEPGIFFFLANAPQTMMETNFMYIVTDSYIPITQQPVLNMNVSN